MEELLYRLERAIWGWPLLGLLLGSGAWLLLRLRGEPLLRLPLAMRLLFAGGRGQKGRVTAFGALCTALSATIGTGNIVGVATALCLGGPGALFWMELSALTGLSLKYAEGWLAVRYRYRGADGAYYGGPFAYISLGLGPKYRFLARSFALFGTLAGICGVGTFVQVGSVTASLTELLCAAGKSIRMLKLPWGGAVPAAALAMGLLLAPLAALFLFRGMEGVSRLSTVLVPVMGAVYVGCCLWVLLRRLDAIPGVMCAVFRSAFRPESLGGGVFGTLAAGVSRGVFSNEAGLGTAPIAAASAEGVSPREQGLISMTATVFDTLLICTLTGLVILVTGSEGVGVGAAMTAFARGLPLPELLSRGLVFGMLGLFAFTTVLGWSCYGAACLDHLTGGRSGWRSAYRALYTLTVALAPLCSARGVWTAANICNGLMAIPNVLAILLLSGQISRDSRAAAPAGERRSFRLPRRNKRLEANEAKLTKAGTVP